MTCCEDNSNEIDKVVPTAIPDTGIDKDLFEVVTWYTVHVEPNILLKTITGNDGYLLYRRRSTDDNEKQFFWKWKKMTWGNFQITYHRWVLPFCENHKYICKNVNKGSGMVSLEFEHEVI